MANLTTNSVQRQRLRVSAGILLLPLCSLGVDSNNFIFLIINLNDDSWQSWLLERSETSPEMFLSRGCRLQLKSYGTRWRTEGKRRGNWRMEWVVSTLHTTSEHGVPSITTADAHTSAASSRLNWCPRWFKWTLPFRRKTKSGFCARAITFQLACTWEGHKQQFSRQVLQISVHLNGTHSWYGNWECAVIWLHLHKIKQLVWQYC